MSGADSSPKEAAINTTFSCVGSVRPSWKARVEDVGWTLALIIYGQLCADAVLEELWERVGEMVADFLYLGLS